MQIPQKRTYTSEDYWNLPDYERAELIDGQLILMAPPYTIHQLLISELCYAIGNYIKSNQGNCKVLPAPFAVNLTADDTTWVEPDISVICDKTKLSERGCEGAPDLIIEIVSPSSRRIDYLIKNTKYEAAGVREYWIVDPAKERTTIYRYEEDAAPIIIPFHQSITVGIYSNLNINISELIK